MKPVDVTFDRGQTFDLIVASCGYERRSSYLARLGVQGQAKYAIDFGVTAAGSMVENREIYAANGWTTAELDVVLQMSEMALSEVTAPTMLLDISSMPRRTLGAIVEWLWGLTFDVVVQFVYCPAQFDGSLLAANRVEPLSAGPVSKFFAGELRAPSVPIGLVVGLGLEPHRTLGLVELLEPSKTWAFVSDSFDDRFAAAASKVHRELLQSSDPPLLFRYDVRSMSETYLALESLSFAAGLNYRLLMAPSGPKIFSLACMLVGAPRGTGRPAVWRVGSAAKNEPVDVEEAGEVTATEVRFGARSRALFSASRVIRDQPSPFGNTVRF